MMKRTLFVMLLTSILSACAQKTDYLVTIQTRYGDMVAILYDETPKHKENFVKLVEQHYFDSLLFHRVMPFFMIQGGDPNSRNAPQGAPLGDGGPGYTVPAEFNPGLFHVKGALAAARQSDQVNPTKASSGSQFYIVQGKTYGESELASLEGNIGYARKVGLLRAILGNPKYAASQQAVMEAQRANDGEWLNSFVEKADTLIRKEYPDFKPYQLTEEQKKAYIETGGTPSLDGDYTVFGRVISGLDVIDKIANVPRDQADRPVDNVRMAISVKEVSRKQIEKEYGDVYP